MLKQVVRLRVGLVVLLGILLFYSGAVANGNNYGGPNRGERHYYRDGRWYKHDNRGHEVSVADIVVGAIAVFLPPQHQTIVIQNTQYYHDGSHYYREAPGGGYVVVDPPVFRIPVVPPGIANNKEKLAPPSVE